MAVLQCSEVDSTLRCHSWGLTTGHIVDLFSEHWSLESIYTVAAAAAAANAEGTHSAAGQLPRLSFE